MCSFYFFFFKQKTAYEMRISDWSSDVCSSDLRQCGEFLPEATVREMRAADAVLFGAMGGPELDEVPAEQRRAGSLRAIRRELDVFANLRRSAEHTYELQSLMRISYAVFCLKKKKNTQRNIKLRPLTNEKNN